jgi:biotin carboxyl carrier protein
VQYQIEANGKSRTVQVRRVNGKFAVLLDGQEWIVDAARVDAHSLSLLVDGLSFDVTIAAGRGNGQLAVSVGGVPVAVELNGNRSWAKRGDTATGSGPQRVVAPMPGKVVRVAAAAGAAVEARQPLVVIEAMKMENELRASRPGVVAEVHVKEGESVEAGALLLVVSPA